jgi:FeS assembly SUF system protein
MSQEHAKLEDSGAGRDLASDAGGETEGSVARARGPLEPGQPTATFDQVADALRTVYDPEIPVNIYELGLIYRLDIAPDGRIAIDMTLTAPGCPVAGTLPQNVADAAAGVEGAGEVEVRLVWDPPWTPDRMSDDAKLALDIA